MLNGKNGTVSVQEKQLVPAGSPNEDAKQFRLF